MNSDDLSLSEDMMKKLRVTTMTLIFGLKCNIELPKLFYLLQITKIDFKSSTKARTRYKIPHHSVPGSILSMRYCGQTRGIIRSTSGTHFKNSITIDISLKEKNLNIKLCASKMQMCGAKSVEQGYEGANELLKKIGYIQSLFERMNQVPEKKKATIDFIRKHIRNSDPVWTLVPSSEINPMISQTIYQDLTEKLSDLRKDENIYEELALHYYDLISPYHDTITKDEVLQWLKESLRLSTKVEMTGIEEEEWVDVDTEFMDFIMNDFYDYGSVEGFEKKIQLVEGIENLYEGELEIDWMSKAMVNFNYSLGSGINRFQLKQYVNGTDGFYAHFDNSTEHYVTIELPYESIKEKKRQNKIPCHSFLVYKSGLVTQSGPDEVLMKQALQKFIHLFEKIKSYVITDE